MNRNQPIIKSIDEFGPAPTYELLNYPGLSPSASFIFTNKQVELLRGTSLISAANEWLTKHGSLSLCQRYAILSSGSNSNPAQIKIKLKKSQEDEAIPYLLAKINGVVPVYSGHISTYGAIPATLEHIDTSTRELFVAFLTHEQLIQFIESEHGNYQLSYSSQLKVNIDNENVQSVYAFVSNRGVLYLNDQPILLDKLSEDALLRSLFEKFSDINGMPTVDEYCSNPHVFKNLVETAIQERNLCQPHRIKWQKVEINEMLRYKGG